MRRLRMVAVAALVLVLSGFSPARALEPLPAEVKAVERIIEEEVSMLMKWWKSYNVRPVIKSLMKRAEEIRSEQYVRLVKKLPALTAAERQAIDLLTRSIVDKILRDPIMFLKSGEGTNGPETVSRMFGLNDGSES